MSQIQNNKVATVPEIVIILFALDSKSLFISNCLSYSSFNSRKNKSSDSIRSPKSYKWDKLYTDTQKSISFVRNHKMFLWELMNNSIELLTMIIAHTKRICVIALASIVCVTIIGGSFLSVNAQRPDSNHLPILLIHGYAQDSSVWFS